MESVELQLSILLIFIAACHIIEEYIWNFTRFLNTSWLGGTPDCPVGKSKSIYIDKIGLFAAIAITALLGAVYDGRWFLFPAGIFLADFVQHFTFSIVKRSYTPGVATSTLYLVFLVYYFNNHGLPDGGYSWLALLLGASVIALNYLLAWNTVRRGGCREAVS